MLVWAVSNVTNESIDVFWNMSPGNPPACTSWLRLPIVMSLMNQPALPSPAVPPIGGETKMRVETIYDPVRAHLKIIIIGDLAENAELFRFIGALIGSAS